ncbi:hypothetical protein IST455A_00999 [Burkholderia multivorans]|uniref:hypothetical protein n=1 Tax=Burkholderia multivorans TaxID=87883 RepID=UPI00123A9ACD|nr:hypothetical protein [Burkholderia multivorans]MBU9247629.1 hypothetical protein [Burkholderia multivorans]QET31716.1 hypothetical protein FOB31_18885 [Burkholderia multivorans]QET40864.1 hypothetical protein FOB30_24975 [Burkholderia multivorans]CAB5280158.1 hypothetical protein IST495A_03484 [Burkholderia multivorans]CAB5300614.1 hypothetical protein IST419_01126 [Burkholderia multivorans]
MSNDYEYDFEDGPTPFEHMAPNLPEHVRRAIAKRQAGDCGCFDPSAEPQWIDRDFMGMTDDHWELSRMRCARCGTPWVRGFLEFEAFSRSGRHYRSPTTDAALQGVSRAEDALSLIEEASFRIAGGSRFGGEDFMSPGPGPLNSNL